MKKRKTHLTPTPVSLYKRGSKNIYIKGVQSVLKMRKGFEYAVQKE